MPDFPAEYEDSLEGFLSMIAPWTEAAAPPSLTNWAQVKWPSKSIVYSFKQDKEGGVFFKTFKTPVTSTLITEENYMDILEKIMQPNVYLTLKQAGILSFLNTKDIFDPPIQQISTVLQDEKFLNVLSPIIAQYALGTTGIFKLASKNQTPDSTSAPAKEAIEPGQKI